MYWSQRVFDHWRKHYEIRDKKYHNRLFGTASKLWVSIKCGRGPWTVDRLKCGLLPVDSTFFFGPHWSFFGHF